MLNIHLSFVVANCHDVLVPVDETDSFFLHWMTLVLLRNVSVVNCVSLHNLFG